MKAFTSTAVVVTTCISLVQAQAGINTAGTPSSCGQNTCCIPSCELGWTDSQGCTNAQATTASACNEAFFTADDTTDTGVDICNGAGAFFCGRDNVSRVVFVVNQENSVAAALFPTSYPECTQSGQCAPCNQQGSCENPVVIGTSTTHSCAAFNALLTSSGIILASC